MKVTIERNNQAVDKKVSDMDYGIYEFHYGTQGWLVGIVCYASVFSKQLVCLSDPEKIWPGGTSFEFRPIKGKITIEL